MTDAETLVNGLRNLMVSVVVYMTDPDPLVQRDARVDADRRAESLARAIDAYVRPRSGARGL